MNAEEGGGLSGTTAPVPAEPERIVDEVRARYGRIAREAGTISGDSTATRSGSCCGGVPGPSAAPAGTASCCAGVADTASAARWIGYGEGDLAFVGDEANLGLGCGAPVGLLDLQPGEHVLDLGSGAGIDVFLAARAVGPTGRAIGVDMTPEMVDRARDNAARMDLAGVTFLTGRLEALPLADNSVDAVTSNCVINLVPDKSSVFREVARVLRPGGRLVVSDIVLDAPLPAPVAEDLLSYVGCVAGAMLRGPYFALLAEAGLGEVTVLRDVDYLAAAAYVLPEEVAAAMARIGLRPDDLAGKVRSVTYRASKPRT